MRRKTLTSLVGAAVAVSSVVVAGSAEAQRIRPDYWGMHASDWVAGPSVPVGSANFTTTGTYWPYIEVKKGKFYWGRLDAQVAAAEAADAMPMVLLGPSPKFHSTRPRSPDHRDFMPRKLAWKRYVGRLVQRYGDRIEYQIWPEPNIIQNWRGTPRQMARLTAWASRVIRRVEPDATVVSPGVALRLDEQRAWTMRYFSQRVGGKPLHHYIDAVAIDPFPMQAGGPEDAYRIMKQIKRRLRAIGVRKPIWVNEINYGVLGGHAPTPVKYSVDRQQAYVVRTYLLAAAAGMKRTYWLGWGRYSALGVQMLDKRGRRAGPALAYKRVHTWLDGSRLLGCKARPSGLWSCKAVAGSELRRIYWKVSGSARVRTPRSPLRIEDQEGRAIRPRSRTITVDFRPVMVASRR